MYRSLRKLINHTTRKETMTDNLDKDSFEMAKHWGEQVRQEILDAGYEESPSDSEMNLRAFYKANQLNIKSIKNVLELMHKDNPQAASFYLFESDYELKRCADIRPISSYGSTSIVSRVFNFLSDQYNREMTCTTLGITSVEPGVVPSSPFDIYKDAHVFKVTF